MATFNDIKSRTSPSRWLRLKGEGDTCFVAFVLNPEAEDNGVAFYPQHWDGKRYILCPDNDTCQLCAAKNTPLWRMAVTVINLETGEKQILDGFPAMWYGDLQDMLEEYDWQETGFKIKRTGQKAQTRRTLMPKPLNDEQKVALKMAVPFTVEELMPKPKQADVISGHSDDPLDPGPDDDDMPF